MPQRIAYLDLDMRKVEVKEVPEEITRRFLGGRGINVYLLYHSVGPETHPLSPQNPLIIGPGMVTGLKGISASRCNISGKSPESGLLGDSNIGGYFGAFMKRTGIDFLFITGASSKPVYIYLDKERISIEDARDLWGRSTTETDTILAERYGPSSQSISIGVAGENLVRFACIINRKKNTAGRTGMGCLMGSKKIKAIVVNGKETVKPEDEAGFDRLMRGFQQGLKKEPLVKLLGEYGSSLLYILVNRRIGMGRSYNGLSTKFPGGENISPNILKDKYYTGKAGCYSCPVSCHHKYRAGEIESEGPEYSILASFGPVVGIKRLETVLYINDLINRYGLDSSSTANLIAWTIELYKRGLMDQSVTDGLGLDWGNEEAIIELIHRIAHRKGLGNILADGAREAVRYFGEETGRYLLWSKNLPQTDPADLRYFPAYALGDATASRGPDHLRSRPTWESYRLSEETLRGIYGGDVSANPRSYLGKGRVIWWWETYLSLFDALGICKLIAFHCQPGLLDFAFFSELVRCATGIDLTAEEIFAVGERIVNLERMFLVREGIKRKDDFPPPRYFEPLVWQDGLKTEEKDLKLDRAAFEGMLDEYYRLRGWDSEGVPLSGTKERLGLAR
ncbi:MAG: aldehyde ferredoxin oxidoreductase family protein [Dehalococcoidales bacterium]|nr:aldehyde ferredoxin oxidoreductase family protein [Dehalococcoidales bacterium]